jgi:uncharacterized membrane protein YeaQ/YmgE (transglycosylase-associated protein family)
MRLGRKKPDGVEWRTLRKASASNRKRRRVMGILSWIVMGFIAGWIAKIIMPGKDPGGFFITILIGVAGGLIGGFIGSSLGLGTVTGFNIGSFLLAIGGSILLLILYRLIKRR